MILPTKQAWGRSVVSCLAGLAALALVIAVILLFLYFLLWGILIAAIVMMGFYLRSRLFGLTKRSAFAAKCNKIRQ